MGDDKQGRIPGAAGDTGKAERLAAALRANLKRRKNQARAQSHPAQDGRAGIDIPENPQKSEEE